MRNPSLLRVLARSFLAGESTVEQITARAGRTLGRQWRWLQPLARRYLQAVADRTRPRHRDVIRFFLNDRGFGRAWSKHFHELSVEQWLTEPQRMQPVPAAGTWDVPRIESVGALCDWLWLDPGQLEWFADLKGLILRKNRPLLGHYHYRVLSKRDGTIRLIEAPKPRLKNCSGKSSPNFWSASHPTHPYTDSSKGDPSERSPPLMWVNGLSYGWI